MPDIPNRDELERKLARALGKLNRVFMMRLLELMGDPPNVDNVPLSFWDEMGAEQLPIFFTEFERGYLMAAERLLEESVIGVDWALVNQRAADWARQHAGELVTQITATSRDSVLSSIRNSVTTFFEQPLTHPDLVQRLQDDPALARLFTADVRDKLGRVFGPTRAEMIAATEVTRSAAEGELGFMRELEAQGIVMQKVWLTAVDERVCPICEPLNNQVFETTGADGTISHPNPDFGVFTSPPAHPRCRCSLRVEFIQ